MRALVAKIMPEDVSGIKPNSSLGFLLKILDAVNAEDKGGSIVPVSESAKKRADHFEGMVVAIKKEAVEKTRAGVEKVVAAVNPKASAASAASAGAENAAVGPSAAVSAGAVVAAANAS